MTNEAHERHHTSRAPVPGHCISIDQDSWHRDGQLCEDCGFGIDDFGDGRGFWCEPLVAPVHPAAIQTKTKGGEPWLLNH